LSGDAFEYLGKLNRYLVNDVDGTDDYLKLKVFSEGSVSASSTSFAMVMVRERLQRM
jgi:hypothetical protein